MASNDVNLKELLTSHDDGVLLKKPISVRMPVHLMARITALNEIFPNKTRSESLLFCLKMALELLERQTFPEALPESSGDTQEDEDKKLAHTLGELYRLSANKHHRQLLAENGYQPPLKDLFEVKQEASHGK